MSRTVADGGCSRLQSDAIARTVVTFFTELWLRKQTFGGCPCLMVAKVFCHRRIRDVDVTVKLVQANAGLLVFGGSINVVPHDVRT